MNNVKMGWVSRSITSILTRLVQAHHIEKHFGSELTDRSSPGALRYGMMLSASRAKV